ncbi:MAG: LysM peptidoglycan-binding domain-containing protein [Chloroflexi bacterium]|nr:LysM peptidoglycan-binding domain-containing protein [Chloroflexota bacterium]
MERSLEWTYQDHAGLGVPPDRLFPVAGLYQEGAIAYPGADDVREFVRRAADRGSRGVSFWSYEHMSEEMWQAVAGVPLPEEGEMSSQEFRELAGSLSTLAARVDRLEAEVRSLSQPPVPAPVPQRRTYTVVPGDTLSGIAAAFGLADWHALYEANRDIVGGDPNLIFPGQVLVIP